MLKSSGFYDYCVNEECVSSEKYQKTIRLLYEFGYRTLAINQLISDENIETKKKKKKGEARDVLDVVPAPLELRIPENLEGMKILNRLTVKFSNQECLHKITKSVNYKKYHIIAALPTSMPAFSYTCNNFDADILTHDPENKNTLKLSRKLYNQLTERGYHFELLYAPAIEDSTKRKNTIHLAHLYHAFGKSKNIIISSGASNPMHLRGPYDIMCLGPIFGLNEQQSRSTVTTCGRNTFLRSVGRRHGKAVMFVMNADEPKVQTMDKTARIEEDEEDMEVEQPVLKKPRQ